MFRYYFDNAIYELPIEVARIAVSVFSGLRRTPLFGLMACIDKRLPLFFSVDSVPFQEPVKR